MAASDHVLDVSQLGSTSPGADECSPRSHTGDALFGLTAVLLGAAIGALTSFGQTALGGTVGDPIVNSASAWLVAPFIVGIFAGSVRGGAAAGLVCCLAQLIGYDVTSEMRGFAAGSSLLLFWGVCAVIGGPLFGAAGHLYRKGEPRVRPAAAAMLPAAFLAEGVVAYGARLHYYDKAALWIAVGVVLAAVLASLIGRRCATAAWVAALFVAGALAEVLLGVVYSQTL